MSASFNRNTGRGMTLAQAAQAAIELGGKYDGHELPKDINAMTKDVSHGTRKPGIDGRREGQLSDGRHAIFVCRELSLRLKSMWKQENSTSSITSLWSTSARSIHPHSLGGQVLGRSMLGIGHAIGQKTVYDQHYGVPLATRFYQNKPPTILDAPSKDAVGALDIPDPETPVGARGIGEPPVAAGCNAVLNALANAVGDEVFRRAPVMASDILASLEAGHPAGEPLTAHI